STREIDQSLAAYAESVLSESCLLEARSDKTSQLLLLHLPDKTWVYDIAASREVGVPVWFHYDSDGLYRAREFVWCYDRWLFADPTTPHIGVLDLSVSTCFGQPIPWEFGTAVIYNEGRSGVINSLELIGLPGRVALGADPTVWTSYSHDGETW